MGAGIGTGNGMDTDADAGIGTFEQQYGCWCWHQVVVWLLVQMWVAVLVFELRIGKDVVTGPGADTIAGSNTDAGKVLVPASGMMVVMTLTMFAMLAAVLLMVMVWSNSK